MEIFLRIVGFHNCRGCMRKVRITLRKIGGVELVQLDPESGNVAVTTTTKHPEVIREALERRMKKQVVIVSRDIAPANQNPNQILIADQVVPTQPTFDLQDLGKLASGLAHVLDGDEVNLNHRQNRPFVSSESGGNHPRYGGVDIEGTDVQYAPPTPIAPRPPPWPAVEPSAPLIPITEEEVYGYPPEFFGFYSPCNHDHDRPTGWCIIL